jgi:uncharacterized integral membrane protein
LLSPPGPATGLPQPITTGGLIQFLPQASWLRFREGVIMRYVYIGLIVVVTAVVLLFKIQNLTSVTVSLFSMSVTMPVSLLVIGVYILGMLSGSALWSLLRGWLHGATRKVP